MPLASFYTKPVTARPLHYPNPMGESNHERLQYPTGEGVANGDVSAFGRGVVCSFNLEDVLCNGVREAWYGKGDDGRAADRVGRIDEARAPDRREILIQNSLEPVAGIDRCEIGEGEDGVPAKDAVVVPEKAHEKVEVRIDELRGLRATFAQSLGCLKLHPRGGLAGRCDEAGERRYFRVGFRIHSAFQDEYIRFDW